MNNWNDHLKNVYSVPFYFFARSNTNLEPPTHPRGVGHGGAGESKKNSGKKTPRKRTRKNIMTQKGQGVPHPGG